MYVCKYIHMHTHMPEYCNQGELIKVRRTKLLQDSRRNCCFSSSFLFFVSIEFCP